VNYYRSFEGMCWPAPGPDIGDLTWRLIHCDDISKTERIVAANVISAYAELIRLPERLRNQRIRELRKGPGIVKDTAAIAQQRGSGEGGAA
jgi:hypothetical protein